MADAATPAPTPEMTPDEAMANMKRALLAMALHRRAPLEVLAKQIEASNIAEIAGTMSSIIPLTTSQAEQDSLRNNMNVLQGLRRTVASIIELNERFISENSK